MVRVVVVVACAGRVTRCSLCTVVVVATGAGSTTVVHEVSATRPRAHTIGNKEGDVFIEFYREFGEPFRGSRIRAFALASRAAIRFSRARA